MAAELNLLPCPICGGEAHTTLEDHPEAWWVGCKPSGCVSTDTHPELEDAVAVWNRRAAPSASASDELPEPEFKAYEYSADAKVWSEDEVRAILAAARARKGEPDAFMVVLSGGEPVAMNFQRVNAEAKLREWEGAGEIVPLYRAAIKAAAPADAPKLDADELPPLPEADAYVEINGEYQKVWDAESIDKARRDAIAADRRTREHELAEASRAGRMYQRKVDQKIIDRRAAGSEKAQAGWKLVPKEPTQAMCDAARIEVVDWQNSGELWTAMTWFRIYRAMLRAAPINYLTRQK